MKHASKTIQVYLVDDHRLVLDGLRQLLESTPDIRVCGTACSLRDARAGLSTVKPDMVVVDLSLADGNGLDLMDDPILRGRNCPVLVLSMRDEQFYAPQSIQRGARGFVS
jgi:DNA-binding NarL/FixJ family response regulator